MCLAPKMPKPPEPPPPPPAPVITGTQPTTVKPLSKRATMQQASRGPSSLSIPLGGSVGGAGGSTSTSLSNLSIGK